MRECYYAREPFDLRLAMLCLIKRAGLILFTTLAGTLLFGGGYYLKNVIFGPEDTYGAKSTYSVVYAGETKDQYINAYTWNVWVHTDEFLENVKQYLDDGPDRETLSGYLSADLPSDLRMPTSLVVTPDPGLSVEIAAAVEKSFLDFASRQDEIKSIRVVDRGDTAGKVLIDVRPLRAFILSGVLTFFLTVVFLCIWEAGGDQIWLPAILKRRYGLEALGTPHSVAFGENLRYLFRGKRDIGVIGVGDMDLAAVVNALEHHDQALEAESKDGVMACEGTQDQIAAWTWTSVPGLTQDPEGCRRLRKMDGILLAVPAGSHVGKRLEYVLELLDTQGLQVTAALLWDADEKMIRNYYRFSKERV